MPHFTLAAKLFKLIDKDVISAYITASTITDIYYIAKRSQGHQRTIEFITNLIEVIEVVGVDSNVNLKAIQLDLKDFEGAVQVSAAVYNDIDYLITRNVNDFNQSGLKVYSPTEFIDLNS